jgi:hypothetical protein
MQLETKDNTHIAMEGVSERCWKLRTEEMCYIPACVLLIGQLNEGCYTVKYFHCLLFTDRYQY